MGAKVPLQTLTSPDLSDSRDRSISLSENILRGL